MQNVPGVVYLIHFEKPLAHSSHYIGWASNLEGRLWHHHNGTGARILAAANENGIKWHVVEVWPNEDRYFERQLKNRKGASRFCPVCREEVTLKTAIRRARVAAREWLEGVAA